MLIRTSATTFGRKSIGRIKDEICYPAGCEAVPVSFVDSDGVEHAVELDARSVPKLWAGAVRFKRHARVHGGVAGAKHPTPADQEHVRFDAWLKKPGKSPADVIGKSRLKELLGDVARR
jgi:hypothetical protein